MLWATRNLTATYISTVDHGSVITCAGVTPMTLVDFRLVYNTDKENEPYGQIFS